MDSKTVQIIRNNETPLVDQNIVDTLKDWLALAEEGRFRGIMLVALGREEFFRAWAGNWKLSEALGTFELAKYSFLEESQDD